MGILYIKYQVSPSVWSFWMDYTPEGIVTFHQQDRGLNDGTTPLHGSDTSQQSAWTTADMESAHHVMHRPLSQHSTQPSVSAASASQQDFPSTQPYAESYVRPSSPHTAEQHSRSPSMPATVGTSTPRTNLLPTTIDVTQTPRHMPYLPAGDSHLFTLPASSI